MNVDGWLGTMFAAVRERALGGPPSRGPGHPGTVERRAFARPRRSRPPDHRTIARRFARSVVRTGLQPRVKNENPIYDWIVDQTGLPYLKLSIDVPVATIQREIAGIQELFVPHRDYGSTQGWSSFCIHGKSFDATREDEYYTDDRPFIWTPEAVERMPETVRYFQQLWPHDRYHRLRVMKLSPGGYIGVHQDSPENRLGPINIAVTQPAGCRFFMEGCGIVPFAAGDAIFLNVSYHHAVLNDSPYDRYHIIVHQQPSDGFKSLVVRSYRSHQG